MYYWLNLTGEWLNVYNHAQHADWFRTSTGQLCIELGANFVYGFPDHYLRPGHVNTVGIPISMSDTELVNKMNIKDLLEIFCHPHWTSKTVSLQHGHVHLGALYSLHDKGNPYVPMVELLHIPEIAHLSLCIEKWGYIDGERHLFTERIGAEDTGWTW